jgi:hypothetical protein
VLVDSAVDVAPHTGHLHIGFVDNPAITNTVTTRPRCVDHERSEALHPSLNGDMVDLDAVLGEKFFDIAVRESVAATTTTTNHPSTLRPRPVVNATVPVCLRPQMSRWVQVGAFTST